MGDVIAFPTGMVIEKDKRLRCACGSDMWIVYTAFESGQMVDTEDDIWCMECNAPREMEFGHREIINNEINQGEEPPTSS